MHMRAASVRARLPPSRLRASVVAARLWRRGRGNDHCDGRVGCTGARHDDSLHCTPNVGAVVNPLLPMEWQQDLILASASPRRAAILAMLGFEFEVVTTAVENEPLHEPDPVAHARAQARRKAAAVAGLRPRGTCIGADTIVVVDGAILGKPITRAAALWMQRQLRGRWHEVHTGLALQDAASGRSLDAVETTAVRFHDWDDAVLHQYVDTGECDDKAGAYAIQGFGAMLVEEIRGCYYNVMGLPVQRFLQLLRALHDAEVASGR